MRRLYLILLIPCLCYGQTVTEDVPPGERARIHPSSLDTSLVTLWVGNDSAGVTVPCIAGDMLWCTASVVWGNSNSETEIALLVGGGVQAIHLAKQAATADRTAHTMQAVVYPGTGDVAVAVRRGAGAWYSVRVVVMRIRR